MHLSWATIHGGYFVIRRMPGSNGQEHASPDFEGQQCWDFKKLQNVPRVIAIAISRLPINYHIESGDFDDG